jgi:single-strand DNA-binding protein
MASLNQITLIGNLTKDPETKTFENGGSVTNISVATNYTYKRKDGEKVEETEFFDCVLNGHSAKFAQDYAHKGMNVFVQGRLKTDTYEKDGVTQYRKKVRGDQFSILGNKSDNSTQDNNYEASSTEAKTDVETEFDKL